ncbi:MAG TPA: hypothetical protein VFA74_14605 [Terriglobales bacterium]|nr:hypothetical protein [Terriglobales bacterium]
MAIMTKWIQRFWTEEVGLDTAEYAVIVAILLILVIGTARLIGARH